MRKPEYDVARLPQWAQREITRLQREVAHLRERLETGPEDSDVFAHPYSESPTPLGKDACIEFHLNGRSERLTVRINEDRMLSIMGSDSIEVLPHSSNLVEIKIRRRG